MSAHLIKEEAIFGPSSSEIVPVISSFIYRIQNDEEGVKLTYDELKHLAATIVPILERDKPIINFNK